MVHPTRFEHVAFDRKCFIFQWEFWHSSNTALASGAQIIGDAPADTTAVNNANEGVGRRET
jgi:hypothetical protein